MLWRRWNFHWTVNPTWHKKCPWMFLKMCHKMNSLCLLRSCQYNSLLIAVIFSLVSRKEAPFSWIWYSHIIIVWYLSLILGKTHHFLCWECREGQLQFLLHFVIFLPICGPDPPFLVYQNIFYWLIWKFLNPTEMQVEAICSNYLNKSIQFGCINSRPELNVSDQITCWKSVFSSTHRLRHGGK